MNLNDILKDILNAVQSAGGHEHEEEAEDTSVVVRSHKMTKRMIAQFAQLEDATDVAHQLLHEAEAKLQKMVAIMKAINKKRQVMWKEIDKEFDIPAGTNARRNKETSTIDVLGEAKEETTGKGCETRAEVRKSETDVEADEVLKDLSV